MSESYCYTVNNRLLFVSIHSQPHCHQRDRIQSFKLSTTQIRRSVYQDSCLYTSKAYFLSHKNTGNFNTLEIKGVFTGYFSIEAKTIDTFPRFSLCNKRPTPNSTISMFNKGYRRSNILLQISGENYFSILVNACRSPNRSNLVELLFYRCTLNPQ